MTLRANANSYADFRTRLADGVSYVTSQIVLCEEPGGEGQFKIEPIGSYVDNGGTILTGGSFAAVRVYQGFADAAWWGVNYDGVTVSTTEAQAAIDANKGGRLVFSGDFAARDLKLNGATYNNTIIVMEGRLRMTSDGSTDTPGAPVAAAMWVDSCDGVVLHFRGDGQRSGKAVRAQIILLALTGCTNMAIPVFDAIECRGDAVYISHTNWPSGPTVGTACDGLHFGRFTAINSTIDGRNPLTIICGRNIIVDDFVSKNFGRLNGGSIMPGGIDLEPNLDVEFIENVRIVSAKIESYGSAALSVSGRSTKLTKNVTCENLRVINADAPYSADINGGTTRLGSSRLVSVANADNVKINGSGAFINGYGVGVEVMGSNDCRIKMSVDKVFRGLYAGVIAVLGGVSECKRCEFDIKAHDVTYTGLHTGVATDCVFKGYVSGVNATYDTTRLAVYCGTGALTSSRFSVGVEYSADWTRPYFGGGATYPGSVLHDIDLSAWSTYNLRLHTTGFWHANVKGVTDSPTIPDYGLWVSGQMVQSTSVAVTANGNILTGWRRMNSGSNNVSGTDWKALYAPTTDVAH